MSSGVAVVKRTARRPGSLADLPLAHPRSGGIHAGFQTTFWMLNSPIGVGYLSCPTAMSYAFTISPSRRTVSLRVVRFAVSSSGLSAAEGARKRGEADHERSSERDGEECDCPSRTSLNHSVRSNG